MRDQSFTGQAYIVNFVQNLQIMGGNFDRMKRNICFHWHSGRLIQRGLATVNKVHNQVVVFIFTEILSSHIYVAPFGLKLELGNGR